MTPRTPTTWTPSSPASTRVTEASSPCTPTGRSWAAGRCGRTGPEVFAGVPDFRAELLRSAQEDDTGWAEWHWHGTRTDGTRLDMRGVTIFGIRDDRIAWGRLYMEDVQAGQGIDQAVRHMARGT